MRKGKSSLTRLGVVVSAVTLLGAIGVTYAAWTNDLFVETNLSTAAYRTDNASTKARVMLIAPNGSGTAPTNSDSKTQLPNAKLRTTSPDEKAVSTAVVSLSLDASQVSALIAGSSIQVQYPVELGETDPKLITSVTPDYISSNVETVDFWMQNPLVYVANGTSIEIDEDTVVQTLSLPKSFEMAVEREPELVSEGDEHFAVITLTLNDSLPTPTNPAPTLTLSEEELLLVDEGFAPYVSVLYKTEFELALALGSEE